ncbi:hypothetical protein PR048_015066 [Dryococelus australis]|uniref:DDE-1 domain-containing protein n=1 Tax=Dryococelus australis TaxID=614101 RepID=A0ABQ9HFZ1_9NEOP|nr:hypothetical protein PR048_015066 [Dryococelus australis]
MEQKLQALFRIEVESLTKIANDLGVGKQTALYVSFCQQYEQGVPLSGVTLQAITLKLNEKLEGDPSFTASVGNASGDLKLPLLVIVKSAKPRALKHVNLNVLPAHYKSQISAWMNGQIFKDWCFKKFVLQQRKKTELFIDNAPCHPTEEELRDGVIFVKFLPPNITVLIQPMDQGVIEATKRQYYYKKMLILSLLEQEADPSANVMDFL